LRSSTFVAHGAEARLFVALDLPAEMRTRLASWARACGVSVRGAPAALAGRARGDRRRSTPTRSRLRLLEADTLHLTLCFLGGQPVGEIEAIGQALGTVCAEAQPIGELALGAPLWLPPRRPRALAVELHDDDAGALGALHGDAWRALAAVCALDSSPTRHGTGGGAAGGRFRPHVTVARMRAGEAPRERSLPPTPPLSFHPRSVTLLRSWLTPAGAVYEELATHALVPGG
jgi:2'-5' RNA ligase